MVPQKATLPDSVVPAATATDGPDDLFALVSGLYVALVSVPLAVAAGSPVLGGAGIQYLTLLGGLTVVTVFVALTVRKRVGLPERLGATRRRWVLVVSPPAVVVFFGVLVVLRSVPSSTATAVYATLSAGGGSIAGAILAMMASTRYARAAVTASETVATWRAGWPRAIRRRSLAVAGAFVALGVVALLTALLWTLPLARFTGQSFIVLAVVVGTLGQPRKYRATETGLQRRFPGNSQFYGWEQFAGFEVSDTAVTLRFKTPWRLPICCDRSSIEHADAVIDALDDNLTRL